MGQTPGVRLLEPLPLRGLTAPNRVLFGPHETNLGARRSLSDRHVAYYARRMAGGVGLVVTEEASVHGSDWPYERCPLASACGDGWQAIATEASRWGTIALAALGHSGGQGGSAYSQRELWAPSGVPEVNTREVPKAMEGPDIDAVVAGFADAARRAVGAGLDGVEINAGQHSLVRQFLSGLTNLRGDDYGTDRELFARRVLEAVRAAVGPEAIVGLRLSCDELAPWAGITPEAGAELAVRLASFADYLVVVRGAIFSVAATRPDGHVSPGFNLDLAGQVRQAVREAQGAEAIPVFAQGSIVDAGQAEWAVTEGRCDGVEMTRAQLADPDLVAKLRAGQAERVRPCILCNQTCKVRDNRNPPLTCVVEPRTGHETEDPDLEAMEPATGTEGRSLTVMGGGPAGLEAARTAAGRGHRVTLVERSGTLGGMVRVAAAGAGRERLALVVDWLESECRRLGVHVVAEPPGPDASGAVIWATGGQDAPPSYPVGAGAVRLSAAQYLAGAELPPDGPIAVWDPIGGPIAVSVAERLAAAGRQTVLITPDFIVGTMLSLSGDLAPASVRLQAAGVTLVRRSLLRAVEAGHVAVEDRFSGEIVRLDAAALVDAGARLPGQADNSDNNDTGDGALRAGDCVAPRTIGDALLDARRAVLAFEALPLAAAVAR